MTTPTTEDHLGGDVQPTVTQPSPTSVQTFTADQVEKFRADERNKEKAKLAKLQADFEAAQAKVNEFTEATAARERVEAEVLAAEQAKAKAAAELDMDAKQLVESRTAELEAKLADMQRKSDQERAALALERQFLENKAYVQGRIAEETAARTIHPTFFDYITGNTTDEIEASIALAKQKTEVMAQEISAREQGQTQQAFQTGQGVSPHSGPSSMGSVSEGGEDIDFTQMSYADFVKNRQTLIRTNTNSGIFG